MVAPAQSSDSASSSASLPEPAAAAASAATPPVARPTSAAHTTDENEMTDAPPATGQTNTQQRRVGWGVQRRQRQLDLDAASIGCSAASH